jgi:hypothetical protein
MRRRSLGLSLVGCVGIVACSDVSDRVPPWDCLFHNRTNDYRELRNPPRNLQALQSLVPSGIAMERWDKTHHIGDPDPVERELLAWYRHKDGGLGYCHTVLTKHSPIQRLCNSPRTQKESGQLRRTIPTLESSMNLRHVSVAPHNNPLQRSVNDKVLARGRASGPFVWRARAQLPLRTAAERGR